MFQQFLLNGIVAGCIYALVSLGFSIIYRTVKFFHFAHGVVYAAGAYIAYSLVVQAGRPPVAGFFFRHCWPASSASALSGWSISRCGNSARRIWSF